MIFEQRNLLIKKINKKKILLINNINKIFIADTREEFVNKNN